MNQPRNDAGSSSMIRKVALASFVGTAIEWYDYFVYGTMAALVFNRLFFPEADALVGTLAAFATFAVGFVARPLGGIVFGHMGDRVGRKPTLVITLLLMGVATFLIGLLPTYASIGVWAPILLVALRIVQGLGLGGEWGGAALLVAEHAPPARRGFFASSVQLGGSGGLLLSAAVVGAVTQLTTEEQFVSWGWRIPFLLSIALIGVGTFVRSRISEPEEFQRLKEAGAHARTPIREAFTSSSRNILLAAGTTGANNVVFYTASVFTVSYGVTRLGHSPGTMLGFQLLAATAFFVATPVLGALSDRLGRRAVIIGGIVAMALFAFPYFWLIDTGSGPAILLAMVLAIAVFQAAAYAPQPAFIPELFHTRVRYSGSALAYNIATMVFGGTAPFVATALAATDYGTAAISLYIMFVCAMSLASVCLVTDAPMLRESAPVPVQAVDPDRIEHDESVAGNVVRGLRCE